MKCFRILFTFYLAGNSQITDAWSFIPFSSPRTTQTLFRNKLTHFSSHSSSPDQKPESITETTTSDSFLPAHVFSSPLFSDSSLSSPWYMNLNGDETLPFSCTGCGKCCKTKGEVYFSPSELKKAASHLDVSISEFKQKYVALESSDKEEDQWVMLKNNEEGGCIFLNEENQCGIYEARPLQCSTYPFVPRIMKSAHTWNEEVRAMDDDDIKSLSTNEEDNTSQKRYWSVEEGGCEGMNFISSSSDEIGGVSVAEAHATLEFFKRYQRQFPQTKFVSVSQRPESKYSN